MGSDADAEYSVPTRLFLGSTAANNRIGVDRVGDASCLDSWVSTEYCLCTLSQSRVGARSLGTGAVVPRGYRPSPIVYRGSLTNC